MKANRRQTTTLTLTEEETKDLLLLAKGVKGLLDSFGAFSRNTTEANRKALKTADSLIEVLEPFEDKPTPKHFTFTPIEGKTADDRMCIYCIYNNKCTGCA